MPTITKSDRSAPHRRALPDSPAGNAGLPARLLRAASALAAACRSRAALAMMSERDLSDVGLLPSEVRSEFCR